MPQRQTVILTDKASTNVVTSGAALTAELANVAYPESANKRFSFDMYPTARAASTGATPVEMFIGGVANFRFRPADQSTVFVKIWGVYTCSNGANDTVFEITQGITNRAGTVIILANSTNVKMPTASTATLVPTIVGGNMVLTATGVAGDTNGRWSAKLLVEEVTDVG
jgi:hypothetical protein